MERSWADIRRSHPESLANTRAEGHVLSSGNLGRPVAAIPCAGPGKPKPLQAQAEARGLEACGYDPAVRVRFQEEADIEAEVMNPTHLLGIMRNPDAEVVQACAKCQ